MTRDLDIDYPMGSPDAKFCRHCKDFKRPHRGALLCDTCDGMAHTIRP